jgi:hypothetical protein
MPKAQRGAGLLHFLFPVKASEHSFAIIESLADFSRSKRTPQENRTKNNP